MSWHLGQIGREAARVAGALMTVAYGPADHAYEVAASAEGPVGRGGRSRPIASFGLFHAITVDGKGLIARAPLESCVLPCVKLAKRSRNVPRNSRNVPRNVASPASHTGRP